MAQPKNTLLEGGVGTELTGIFREPPTPRQKENSGECDFTYSQVIWGDLVLLLADDSCTRCSSSLEAICDASWTRGKGDGLVAVSRVQYTVSQVRQVSAPRRVCLKPKNACLISTLSCNGIWIFKFFTVLIHSVLSLYTRSVQ